jgi:O-antigen/teichoic acid export membrane protein
VEGTLRVAGRLTTGILSLIILRIVDLVVLAVAILFFKSIELWFLCLCLMRLLLLFLFGVYLKSTRFRPVNLDFKQIRSELLFHKWNSTGLVMMTLANYVGVNVSTAFLAATLDSETFAILLSIRMMIGGINQFNRAISNSHYPTIVNYIATNELNEVAKSLSKNIKVNIASSLVFSAIFWVFLNPIAKFVVQVEIVRSDFIVLFFASCLFSSMSIPIYLFALAVEKSFPISLGTLIIYCFSLLILHQMSRSLTLDSLSRVVMLTEVSVCLFSYLALHFLRRNLGHNARN